MTKSELILLVKEEIILADLARALRKQGYEVAGTAQSAAAVVQPDVVLMDVRLQGSMDGAEAARQIRRTSEVPIVFLTANVSALNLGGL